MKEVVRDRRGNAIYLTDERWKHIIETHKQMTPYRDHVLKTLRLGRRRQDPLDPGKYKYSRAFVDLPAGFTHVVVVVKFLMLTDVVVPAPEGRNVYSSGAERLPKLRQERHVRRWMPPLPGLGKYGVPVSIKISPLRGWAIASTTKSVSISKIQDQDEITRKRGRE